MTGESLITQPYLVGFEAEQRRLDLSQFFSPPELAQKMWDWCPRPSRANWRVGEPSAGTGSLIIPMLANRTPDGLVVYEVDTNHLARLQSLQERAQLERGLAMEVRPVDFLHDPDPPKVDCWFQNPPYEHDQDVDFIVRSLELSRFTVGIFRSALVHGQGRFQSLWRWTDIVRMAWLSERPQFGGPHTPKTDFCVYHLRKRDWARLQGEATTINSEWW